MVILTARPKVPVAGGAISEPLPLAEQRFKKLAVRRTVAAIEAAATKFEPGAPVGRRVKFLAGLPIGTQFVVGGAFFRIFENRVGFSKLLEALFCVGFRTYIRVELARQFV